MRKKIDIKLAANIKEDRKTFFHKLKCKSKSRPSTESLIDGNGCSIATDEEIAEELLLLFTEEPDAAPFREMLNIDVCTEDVWYKKLNCSRADKVLSPDELIPQF